MWDWVGFGGSGVNICVGLHKQPPPVNPSTGGGLGRFPGQNGPIGVEYPITLIMSYVNINDINDIANCNYL